FLAATVATIIVAYATPVEASISHTDSVNQFPRTCMWLTQGIQFGRVQFFRILRSKQSDKQ
ncbi:hypothetical protein HK100_004671, partial [Physocladia obscura]